MKIPFVHKIFAQDDIIGTITNPLQDSYGDFAGGTSGGGFIGLFTNIVRIIFVVAGVYSLVNLIIAGFQYMTAAGDSKALGAAWARIWQTLAGLVIIVASFTISAVFGYLLFGDPTFILRPRLCGPDGC
ncbi:hypothetical protein A2154_02265 [Candidatus Gottesmanbacteria bacterium RBG_16_43_7]|uniref:Uncharacterized protein n=1 Tax=Candidatus Gottesmanbacteria bacterium RBG_16_43_7 TaxID=1798373 RepID=A0A1F5ZAM5_9BACT|nr:MAG: hypothetical protein A2154_02265 [Candidatus Gottesmanbacteria bacterium RBG_16_43_7]